MKITRTSEVLLEEGNSSTILYFDGGKFTNANLRLSVIADPFSVEAMEDARNEIAKQLGLIDAALKELQAPAAPPVNDDSDLVKWCEEAATELAKELSRRGATFTPREAGAIADLTTTAAKYWRRK